MVDLGENERDALIGFHAYTGNDYVSAFFRKGKQARWKCMRKHEKFTMAFSQLGESWELNDDNFKILEEFTCLLYGFKDNSVDVVHHKIFEKKFSKDGKVVDLSLFPPCRSVLLLHAQRANYVAKLWRSSLTSFVEMPPIFENGWNNDGTILWVDEVFPSDVTDILSDPDFENERLLRRGYCQFR